jgi:hypothetical protein
MAPWLRLRISDNEVTLDSRLPTTLKITTIYDSGEFLFFILLAETKHSFDMQYCVRGA